MTTFTQIPLTRLKTPGRSAGQRGFALLLVLLMAAAVAFSLYLEIPRVGFESARNREQLLIDRGNQFKRAIEVYYAVNKRYPATLEDLEKASDKRFLRHRYKDPLTGNDEWRLIHTNGSFLTDSLVKKPPVQNAQNGLPVNQGVGGGPLGANNLNTVATGTGSNAAVSATGAGPAVDPSNPNANGQPAPKNVAALRRPSDFTGRPQTFDQNNNPADPNQQNQGFPGFPPNYNANDPSTWPAITLTPVGQQPAGQRPLQQFGAAGNPFAAAQNNAQFNGANGLNNQFNGQPPGFSNQGFPNPGLQNQGLQNQGFQNQGFPNQGLPNPGLQNQGFPNQGTNQPLVIPGFAGQPQTGGVLNIQNAPLGGPINGQPPGFGQDNSAGASQQAGIPGQLPGFGGANPQGNPFATGNPLNDQGTSPAQQAATLGQQRFNQNQNPAAALASAFPGQAGSQQNFNQQNFNQQNFNQQNFNQQNFNQQNFNQQNFNQQNFNQQNFNQQNFNQPNFNTQGTGAGFQQPTNNNNAAVNAINQTLLGSQNGLQGAGGNLGSPGIAGVASKFEGPSIKSYGDRTKYQEWEFVFDPSVNLPAGQIPLGNPLQNQGNQQNQGSQQNPAGQPGPFGGSNTFGQPNSSGQPNPFGPQPQGNGQSPLQGLFGPSGR